MSTASELPRAARYVVVGAGVHGLSTAWHLARRLGTGDDVVDTFRQNASVIADSNHGYKLIGLGALVADELLGRPQDLLAPFRFARYQRGELHPSSASPFPWS